jgi:hypothetical protein
LLALSTEDDNLIEKKRFASIEQELWTHSLLSSEMWSLTHNDEHFKKNPNALKYTIGYAAINMEVAFETLTILKQSEHSFHLRKQILR